MSGEVPCLHSAVKHLSNLYGPLHSVVVQAVRAYIAAHLEVGEGDVSICISAGVPVVVEVGRRVNIYINIYICVCVCARARV